MIYFDNSATTKPSRICIETVANVLETIYANPSSVHFAGTEARKIIEEAREDILSTLGTNTQKSRLVFCGSGSEANNLAILGVGQSKNFRGSKTVLIGAGEHPSVKNTAEQLAGLGFRVVVIPTKGGKLDLDAIREAVTPDTVLCSFMTVNNETGALYDTKAAFALVKAIAPGAVCHTDCVQAYLKTPLTFASSGADMITVSAHKIHGPKGIGALIYSPELEKRRLLSPVIYGGGQESGLRSGTENTAYIAGFAAAAKEQKAVLPQFRAITEAVRERILTGIRETPALSGFVCHTPERHVTHILSIATEKQKSETMLRFLSGKGICVSAGSACSSHDRHLSEALAAYGVPDAEIDRTIRVSLCESNTIEEADLFISALAEGASSLVGTR